MNYTRQKKLLMYYKHLFGYYIILKDYHDY